MILLFLFFLMVLFCLFLLFYFFNWDVFLQMFYFFLGFMFYLFFNYFNINVLFYLINTSYMFLFMILLFLFFLMVLFCLFLIFYILKFLFHICYFFGGYIFFMFMFFNINFFNFMFYFDIFIFMLLFFKLFKFLKTISISSYKFFYLMFYMGIFYILILFVMSVFNIMFLFFSCFNFTFLMQCIVIFIMVYNYGILGLIPFLDLIFENCFYNLFLIFVNMICFIFMLLLFYFYFGCLFNFCFKSHYVYNSSSVKLSSYPCFLKVSVSSLSTVSKPFVKNSSGLYLCNVFVNLDSLIHKSFYQKVVVCNQKSFNVYCGDEEFEYVNSLFVEILKFDSSAVKSVDLCIYKLGCMVYLNICFLKGYDFMDSEYFLLHFNSEMSCSFYSKNLSGKVFYDVTALLVLNLDVWFKNIGSNGLFTESYLKHLDEDFGYIKIYNYDLSMVKCSPNSFLCDFPLVSYDSLVLDLNVLEKVCWGNSSDINNFVCYNNYSTYKKFEMLHSSEALSLLCLLSSDYQHYCLNCKGSCGKSK